MKKIICLLVCILSLCIFAGCKKDADYVLNKVEKENKIIIVTSPDYAPFEFVDTRKTGQDQYVGADVELMKYIALKMGVTLEIKVTNFDTVLALLETGVADLAISGFTYKEDRAENYELSAAYDSEGTQGLLVKAEDASKYNNIQVINGLGNEYAVVAQNGSLQASYVEEFLPNVQLKNATMIIDGLTILNNDSSVVAMSISEKAAKSIMNANPDKYVFLSDKFPVSTQETELYVMAQKGQTGIIEEINKIIAEVIEAGLYTKWLEEAEALQEILNIE